MERLRRLGERWPWLGTALDVQLKVGETNGGATASATTLMFFVAVFPLLIVAIAVLGYVSAGNADLADDLIDQLGLEGAAADVLTRTIDNARDSRQAASVIGLVGLLWSGLGVAAAVTLAVRSPWQRKVKGTKAKGTGVVWLLGGTVLLGASVGAGALLNRTPDVVPRAVTSLGLVLLGLALEVAFFLWTFWILGDRRTGWRPLLPGAVVGAVGLEVLKVAGTVVLPRMVASSSALYGSLGIVLALLAWFALFARLIVYASAINATLWERQHGVTTLEIQAPLLPDEVPVEADRGGTVVEQPAVDHVS